jgi:hypothetical protein
MNSVQILIITLPFVLIFALFVWLVRWQYARADALLDQWVEQNQYHVLKKEEITPAGTGPRGNRYGVKQVVYRVLVSDAAGQKKTARITLGSRQAGIISDEVRVEWELP